MNSDRGHKESVNCGYLCIGPSELHPSPLSLEMRDASRHGQGPPPKKEFGLSRLQWKHLEQEQESKGTLPRRKNQVQRRGATGQVPPHLHSARSFPTPTIDWLGNTEPYSRILYYTRKSSIPSRPLTPRLQK